MRSTLSKILYRLASWKTLLLALLLYVPFPACILKNLERRMNELAVQPIGPIDLLFGYDPARIQFMVGAYGAEGRAIYSRGILTADMAYPLVYTFLFCIILSLLFRNRSYAPFSLVNILPLSIWGFDVLENGCIVYLLNSYPATSDTVAALCSGLTNLKWAATLLVMGMVVYGLLRLLIRNRRNVTVPELPD